MKTPLELEEKLRLGSAWEMLSIFRYFFPALVYLCFFSMGKCCFFQLFRSGNMNGGAELGSESMK